MLCTAFTVCLSFLIMTVAEDPCKTSRACYGSAGPPCTQHKLDCSIGKIFIIRAFHTSNNKCPSRGIVSCGGHPQNISGAVKTNYTEKEKDELFGTCLNKYSCEFYVRQPNSDSPGHSVIKYRCSAGNDTVSTVGSCTETTPTPSPEPNSSSDNKGAIIGAVVVVLVVIGAVVVIVFLIKRRRASKEDRTTNDTKNAGVNYSKPGFVDENYQYDYITDADVRAGNKIQVVSHDSNKHQPGKQINNPLKGQHGFEETDYDRINRKHSNVDNDKYEADYDTTAATNSGLATEDDYGYNHVDRQKVPNANQNNYDTTTSASKDVKATTGDDYDQFKRERAANVVSSPYDTAGNVGSAQDGFSQVGENDHQQDGAVNTVGSLCDVAGTVRQPRDDYCLAGRAEGGGYDIAK